MTIKPKGKIALLAILGIVLFFVASRFIDTDSNVNGSDSTKVSVDSNATFTDTANVIVLDTTIGLTTTITPVATKSSNITKSEAKKTPKVGTKKETKPTQPKKTQSDERENLDIVNF